MFFIIFKLARTGSSRLVKFLNNSPNVTCIPEILNQIDDIDYKGEIHRKLNTVPADKKLLGFSLNPYKYSIKSTDFFDPRPYLQSYGSGQVFSLIREDIFQQAISIWVSSQLKVWPDDVDSRGADQVLSFINEGGNKHSDS